jgi:hypothetical protein
MNSWIYLFASIMCLYETICTHNFIYEEVEGPPYMILPRAPEISGSGFGVLRGGERDEGCGAWRG